MRETIPYVQFFKKIFYKAVFNILIYSIGATFIFIFLPANWFNFLPDNLIYPSLEISKIPKKISCLIYAYYGIYIYCVFEGIKFCYRYKMDNDYIKADFRWVFFKLVYIGLLWFSSYVLSKEFTSPNNLAHHVYECQIKHCSHRYGDFMFSPDVDATLYSLLFYPAYFMTFNLAIVFLTFARNTKKIR